MQGMRRLFQHETYAQETQETQDRDVAEHEGDDDSVQSRNLSASSDAESAPMANQQASADNDGEDVFRFGAGEDDELPDVNALLRHKAPRMREPPSKRQKIKHTFSKKGTLARQLPADSATDPTTVPRDVFDVPPSPPTSSLSPMLPVTTAASNGFRFPRGFSPAALPTPAISSEARPMLSQQSRPRTPATSSPRSALYNQSRNVTARPNLVASDSSSSDSSSSDSEEQLRHIQRRIKGVLPASWLRLDQQTRNKPKELLRVQRPTLATLSKTSPRKGVAKRITRDAASSRSTTPQPNLVISVSDESQEEDPNSIIDAAPEQSAYRMFNASNGFPDVDDMEDDAIDPMLPQASRDGHRTEVRRKRQLRLADSFHVAKKRQKNYRSPHGVSSTDVPRHKLTDTFATKRSKPQAPRLSILDVQHDTETGRRREPDFVRIAARQARKQSDHGRHSPTTKFIRLKKQADTDEATETLRNWRQGAIQPKRQAVASQGGGAERRPLTERSSNQQQLLPPPVLIGKDISTTTEPAQVVHTSTLPNSKLRQSRLKPVIVRGNIVATIQGKIRPSTVTNRTSYRERLPYHQDRLYHSAQLEYPETHFVGKHRQAAFRRGL
ncbi:hypothetical protein LTS18_009860, partial [Coniosporium uncinatum]